MASILDLNFNMSICRNKGKVTLRSNSHIFNVSFEKKNIKKMFVVNSHVQTHILLLLYKDISVCASKCFMITEKGK